MEINPAGQINGHLDVHLADGLITEHLCHQRMDARGDVQNEVLALNVSNGTQGGVLQHYIDARQRLLGVLVHHLSNYFAGGSGKCQKRDEQD